MKLPKIERLPSGSYRAQIQIGGKRHSITGATQKEVEREVAALKLELKRAPGKLSSGTIGSAVDNYIEACEGIRSPSTVRGYREIRRNRFKAYMGKKLSQMDRNAYQAMVDAETRVCAPKTVKNAWGLVRTSIEAETGEKISVRLPAVPKFDHPFLEPEQIIPFVDAIKGKSYEVAALLALSSLRASEVAGLKWGNVDMEKRLIFVRGASVRDSNYKLVNKKTNKNDSSARTVPMIRPLYEALLAAPRKGEYVVTITTNYVYQVVNETCERLGFPKVGLHGLRHSFASLSYSLNIPEKLSMEMGGWKDDKTMRKIYTHIASRDRAHFGDSFTGFFEPDGKMHTKTHTKYRLLRNIGG